MNAPNTAYDGAAAYKVCPDRAKMIAIKKVNKKYRATVIFDNKLGNGG